MASMTICLNRPSNPSLLKFSCLLHTLAPCLIGINTTMFSPRPIFHLIWPVDNNYLSRIAQKAPCMKLDYGCNISEWHFDKHLGVCHLSVCNSKRVKTSEMSLGYLIIWSSPWVTNKLWTVFHTIVICNTCNPAKPSKKSCKQNIAYRAAYK